MTEQQLLTIEQNYGESKIQHTCVSWFRQTFPMIGNLLFAVPNGGWRGAKAALMMRYEGQVNGVADLVLLPPSGIASVLCIEMKVPKKKGRSAGRQSEAQKAWQTLVESNGNRYAVCHGLVEFINVVCSHLGLEPQQYVSKALNRYPQYQ